MYCPRCKTKRETVNGHCAYCGYSMITRTSDQTRSASQYAFISPAPAAYRKERGDMMHNGRYRLGSRIILPVRQQKYGLAWSALDTQAASRHNIVIREVIFPQEIQANDRNPLLNTIIERFVALGQHPGLPKLIDTFNEQGTPYLVFLHREGESLAALLSRQGGALSERTVASYGWSLCEILSFLSSQQPPFVHGSINPETIIVGDESKRVSLIHLPLFASYETLQGEDKNVPGYLAPEQLRGQALPASDLYSVAAILHHAVTGYAPSGRVSFFYPPTRRLNPAVTQTMESILSRQLRLSIPQRYVHPADMQKDLHTLLESYSGVEKNELPVLFADPLRLSPVQEREWSHSANLLNMGVLASIMVLIIVGIMFAILRF